MRAFLVSHTHWDREWYRTFEAFRARLVDAVDRLLDLCAADPGYRFLLDGQTVVLEDYATIRPGRADELRARCREGRIAVGPWYVQPDSLLPSGEAHVRNLLEGRRVAAEFSRASDVAYTPDSFGHPAQFPQLLAGFGLRAFVYWRGHGNEWDDLGAEYDWVAPDGSRLLACHLGRGYFCAASQADTTLPALVEPFAGTARALAERTKGEAILLMNGIDHVAPEARTGALAEGLEQALEMPVERALLEDFVAAADAGTRGRRPEHEGELVGARVAPLLPGVWSTRTWIKQLDRACDAELTGWAEPFAALGARLGLADERPALRRAWRELLVNQAHDSICGCSRDEVHAQMRGRYASALELAGETASRALERIAGADAARTAPWSDHFDVAVFNPSPRPRTDVVRVPLDPHPWMRPAPNPVDSVHPLHLRDPAELAFRADGEPVHAELREAPGRPRLLPDRGVVDLELVARDVPAFGWRRVRIEAAPGGSAAATEPVEPGSDAAVAAAGELRVSAAADGTLDVELGGRRFPGLLGIASDGDRGDSYDFDAAPGAGAALQSVAAERVCAPGGIERLRTTRVFELPAGLRADRAARSEEMVALQVEVEARVAPGVPRVDLCVRVDNTARDHRLRLLFPVPGAATHADAASTFDVVRRAPQPVDDTGWSQRAVPTFCQQGFVHAGGLTVVAPGLPEAELLPGEPARIAITLLRAVGFLSRHDLASRPGPAGPGTPTPEAQCPGPLEARLALLPGLDPAAAREAELGLRGVFAGTAPLAEAGRPLLALDPPELVLSALKPAARGDGIAIRVLNPGHETQRARLAPGFPFRSVTSVRLDEEPDGLPVEREGDAVRFEVAPHALRTVLVR
ncbi:MAG: hypothetical protein QNK03_02565 [Myxococcota bacterium]|nr:hypothetical protein [Myxococcota bacterium]